MTRALALGLGIGAAIQAFRQWPADGPVSLTPAAGVFIVGLLCAYFGGRRGGGASAVAVASASAEASGNVLNVQLFSPSAAAQREPSVFDVRVPEPESVSWLSSRTQASIEPDMLLDGADLEDLGLREINE